MNDNFLLKKLGERETANALRVLTIPAARVDFCSNDYLGIAKNDLIPSNEILKHGSTGSRLLTGNYTLIEETEKEICRFHQAAAGLFYNSGYDANVGLLSCIATKEDTIIYDYLSHASIRDGIRLSVARSFSFVHNDLADLEKKLRLSTGQVFVVTESVFSMDGDVAPLAELASLCDQYNALLVVDEAHATGVIGGKGEGLVQALGLQEKCFARMHTFGKACGAHGAIVLGSATLRNYLVNFSRSFIYTTALPPSAIAAVKAAYTILPQLIKERESLSQLAAFFQGAELPFKKIKSTTPIQAVVVPGNESVKKCAANLQTRGLDVRPILYPTVPKGEERLRIVLHAFNTKDEVALLVKTLNEATA